MLTRNLTIALRKFTLNRKIHTCIRNLKEFENPILRTLRILKEDVIGPQISQAYEEEKIRALSGIFPRHVDILIIGGGAVGSSIAYWLKEKTSRDGVRVAVVEKDTTYSKCSTVLSPGGLHQQYSLPENIQMSLYGADFLRKLKERFGSEADVQFTPNGYLILADEEGAQRLIDNHIIEKEFGVSNQILSKNQLGERFPWMNDEDVEVGSLGLQLSGWFDPWALLTALRWGANNLGAQYVEGEVVDFLFTERQDYVVEGIDDSYHSLSEAIIKMPDGELKPIQFAFCIIAAGAESCEVAKLAKIGVGSGMLSVPLPLRTRNRYLYKFDCNETPPGINTPMTVDCTGVYFRRNGLGGSFLGGYTPTENPEMSSEEYFHKFIFPVLKHRVPAFNSAKLTNSWCGTYEHNYFDDTGVIGPHPYYHNLYIATGFSSYGIQQAPALGRGVAELILDGDYKSIDLTRFGFDRFIVDKPMYELSAF